MLKVCLFVCLAGSVAQQPVLSETVVFGACVCGRVSTGVVQTCAVTYHRSFITYTSRPPTLEKHRWRMQVTADQGHSSRKKPVVVVVVVVPLSFIITDQWVFGVQNQ